MKETEVNRLADTIRETAFAAHKFFKNGFPKYICPTMALYNSVYVIEDGKVAGSWDVAARDRV